MSLLILIIIIAEISFLLFFSQNNSSLREAIVKSLISLFTIIFSIIELLSLFNKFQIQYVISILLLIIIILFLFSFKLFSKNIVKNNKKINLYKNEVKKIFNKPLILLILLIFIILIISGTYFPPSNWDSMTYHLTRIGYWIQNSSVEFYPTYNERQLFLGPLAEYFLSIFLLIDRSDKFLFFGQFISMLGSLTIISLISKNIFKQKTNNQIKSSLIALMIPMGLLQATSTQNDYVASFFILSAIFFLFSKKDTIFFSLATSLAILTKLTSIFYIFPIILFWIVEKLKQKKIKPIISFILIFSFINSTHLYRNYNFFGSILGPKSSDYLIGSLEIKYLLINTIKNITLHFQSSFNSWNNYIINFVVNFSKFLNISIDSNGITYLYEKYTLTQNIYDHDYAGNFIHIILIFFSTFFLLYKKTFTHLQKKYVKISILGLVSSLMLIKWQPWGSRLHLPGFILFSPIIILFMKKNKIFEKIIIISMIIFSLLIITFNVNQPLLNINKNSNPEEFRYIQKPFLYNDYFSIHSFIQNNHKDSLNIGIISSGNDWEYPLWYYLYKSKRKFTISSVFFDDYSNIILYENQLPPDVIIDLRNCKINCSVLENTKITEQTHLRLKNTKLYLYKN